MRETQNIVLLRSLLEAQLKHLDVVCDQIRADIVERTSIHVAIGEKGLCSHFFQRQIVSTHTQRGKLRFHPSGLQSHQRLTFVDQLPLGDENLIDDTALQVLHRAALHTMG